MGQVRRRRSKKKKKRQKYNDAPVCKNCGKNHPSKPEDKCWELRRTRHSTPPTGS
jgi:hypothetical protein